MRIKHLTLALSAITLAACSTTSQYTSGKDYLTRYDRATASLTTAQSSAQGSTDLDIRKIAAVEPDLQLPARIGLARIEKGRLISVPGDEAENWVELSERLGPAFGEFVPVSPLIAALVSPDGQKTNSTKEVVNNIRRASARQHLDYTLVYEVTNISDKSTNALRIGDLSVLGLFVLPSRNVKVDSTATAMLIDVRNGYPYVSATAFSEKSTLSTSAGARANKDRLKDKSRIIAVDNLTDEVEIFMFELQEKIPSTSSPV